MENNFYNLQRKSSDNPNNKNLQQNQILYNQPQKNTNILNKKTNPINFNNKNYNQISNQNKISKSNSKNKNIFHLDQIESSLMDNIKTAREKNSINYNDLSNTEKDFKLTFGLKNNIELNPSFQNNHKNYKNLFSDNSQNYDNFGNLQSKNCDFFQKSFSNNENNLNSYKDHIMKSPDKRGKSTDSINSNNISYIEYSQNHEFIRNSFEIIPNENLRKNTEKKSEFINNINNLINRENFSEAKKISTKNSNKTSSPTKNLSNHNPTSMIKITNISNNTNFSNKNNILQNKNSISKISDENNINRNKGKSTNENLNQYKNKYIINKSNSKNKNSLNNFTSLKNQNFNNLEYENVEYNFIYNEKNNQNNLNLKTYKNITNSISNNILIINKNNFVHKSSDFSISNSNLKIHLANFNNNSTNNTQRNNINTSNPRKSNNTSKNIKPNIRSSSSFNSFNNLGGNLNNFKPKNPREDSNNGNIDSINKINLKNLLGYNYKSKTKNSKSYLKMNNKTNISRPNNITDTNIQVNNLKHQSSSSSLLVNNINSKNYINNMNNKSNENNYSNIYNPSIYSKNYITKRYNMIKNNKNFYQEKQDSYKLPDDYEYTNNNNNNLTNQKNSDIINLKKTESNITIENNPADKTDRLIVNKINSFPINYFQKNKNLEEKENIISKTRQEEENLTSRYTSRINQIQNVSVKKMNLNNKSLESFDFLKKKSANILAGDSNNSGLDRKNHEIKTEKKIDENFTDKKIENKNNFNNNLNDNFQNFNLDKESDIQIPNSTGHFEPINFYCNDNEIKNINNINNNTKFSEDTKKNSLNSLSHLNNSLLKDFSISDSKENSDNSINILNKINSNNKNNFSQNLNNKNNNLLQFNDKNKSDFLVNNIQLENNNANNMEHRYSNSNLNIGNNKQNFINNIRNSINNETKKFDSLNDSFTMVFGNKFNENSKLKNIKNFHINNKSVDFNIDSQFLSYSNILKDKNLELESLHRNPIEEEIEYKPFKRAIRNEGIPENLSDTKLDNGDIKKDFNLNKFRINLNENSELSIENKFKNKENIQIIINNNISYFNNNKNSTDSNNKINYNLNEKFEKNKLLFTADDLDILNSNNNQMKDFNQINKNNDLDFSRKENEINGENKTNNNKNNVKIFFEPSDLYTEENSLEIKNQNFSNNLENPEKNITTRKPKNPLIIIGIDNLIKNNSKNQKNIPTNNELINLPQKPQTVNINTINTSTKNIIKISANPLTKSDEKSRNSQKSTSPLNSPSFPLNININNNLNTTQNILKENNYFLEKDKNLKSTLHYKYEKSDEDYTLSEDEKANITNVPIFKSKRFTSFNIGNTDLNFDNLDDYYIKKIPQNPSNLNYSKYIPEIFIKTLFLNSNNTKNSICSFLTIKDLISLSYTDKNFNREIKINIHNIIKNNILQENISLRLKIWTSLYKYSKLKIHEHEIKIIYRNYLKIDSQYKDDILKDINRTMPEDPSFRSGKQNNLKLYNILFAYSNFNGKIGYAQGLNFMVASAILILNEEEQVFLFIDSLVKKFKFNKIMGLKNSRVRMHLDYIQFYLDKHVPRLCQFLSNNGLSHEFFSTNWIITLFANVVNPGVLFKIWDFFIIYGWKFFNSFLISILWKFEKVLLDYDPNYLSISLKSLLKSKDFEMQFYLVVDKAFELMRIENFKEMY